MQVVLAKYADSEAVKLVISMKSFWNCSTAMCDIQSNAKVSRFPAQNLSMLHIFVAFAVQSIAIHFQIVDRNLRNNVSKKDLLSNPRQICREDLIEPQILFSSSTDASPFYFCKSRRNNTFQICVLNSSPIVFTFCACRSIHWQ